MPATSSDPLSTTPIRVADCDEKMMFDAWPDSSTSSIDGVMRSVGTVTARPAMPRTLMAPRTDVFIVLMGLNW